MLFAHKSIAHHKISHTDLLDDFYKNPLQHIVMFPTNRKVRDFTLQVLTKSSFKAISLSNIHTIYTLAQKLFTEGNPKYKLISDSEAGLLLNKVIEKNRERFKHLNFKNYIPQGSVEKLRLLIREYKRNGVDAETISRSVINFTDIRDQNKAHDIAIIYGEYSEELSKLERFEIGDVYRVIKAKSDEEFRSRLDEQFPGLKTILVYGYASFSDPEIKLLKRLSLVEGIRLYIDIDYSPNNNSLFAAAKDSIDMLEKNEFTDIITSNSSESYPLHNALRAELFNVQKLITALHTKKKQFTTDKGEAETIKETLKNFKEYATVEDELLGITVKIKEILKNNPHLNPEDIAIVVRDLSPYGKIAGRAFACAGIPLNSTARTSLTEVFSVSAIQTLLELVATGFYGKSIERAYLTFLNHEKNQLPELQSILKYTKKLRGLSALIKAIAELKQKTNNELYEIGLRSEALLSAEQLLAFMVKSVQPFINTESGELISSCTPELFKESYKKLIVQSGIIDQLLQMDEQYRELNSKALDRTIPIVDAICDMIGYELHEKGKQQASFNVFKEAVAVGLKNAKMNAQGNMNQGVLLTTFDEIRGLKFKYLFIAGLNEGIAPNMYSEDSLYVEPITTGDEITISERKKQGVRDNLNAEKYLFYETLLVCNESENVYFTRHKQDKDQAFSKSMFIDYLIPFYPMAPKDTTTVETIVSDEAAEQVITALYVQNKLSENTEIQSVANTELLSKIESAKLFKSIEENIENTDALSKLHEYSNNKKFSATHFETYVRCGYKYLSRYIMNLKGELDIEDHEENLLIGNIFHSIVEKYLKEIVEKNNLSNWEQYKTKLEQSLPRLREISMNELINNHILSENEKGATSSYTIEPGWFFEVLRLVGDPNNEKTFDYSLVGRFHKGEIAMLDTEHFVPFKFEEVIDSNNTSVLGMPIDGRIDRIDKDEEGNVRVVDYKTGKGEFDNDLIMHRAYIQLPLYAKYVETVLMENNPAEVNAVHLVPRGKNYVNTLDRRDLDFQTYMEYAISVAEKIPDEISKGKFHHSILNKSGKKLAGCEYCEYSGFCRMEEYFTAQLSVSGESESVDNSSES